MSRHYTLNSDVRFDLEFRPSDRATVHGGQLAVAGLTREYGLWEKVAEEGALDPRKDRTKGYEAKVYVAAFLFSFCSGGKSLADGERLNEDEALKAMLGVKKFPDQSALGEWLRQIGWDGVAALRGMVRGFVEWGLERADGARYLHAGQMECFFDDTQLEVEGKHFEGAAVNYDGNVALGWQTLWVGPFLADGILGRPVESLEVGGDVSAHLPGMLEANGFLWKGKKSYLYADSGSSAGKYLDGIDAAFEGWTVSYNKWTSPLEKAATELADKHWSAVEMTKWRDGTQHEAQYQWVRHQPEGCARPQLFATVRHRAVGEMFWGYAFVACKEQPGTMEPKAVFERHRLKGDKERAFSELLSDLDLHHPPCHSLSANNAYYLLGALAYNLLQALKLVYLPPEHQPKRVRTLLHHLLLIPVEIRRHARSFKVLFYAPAGWVAWWKGLLQTLLPNCHLLGRLTQVPSG